MPDQKLSVLPQATQLAPLDEFYVNDEAASKRITFADLFKLAGGVITDPEIKDYAETRPAPASSAGVLTLDLETGNVFEVTLTEDVATLTLSNPPASGKAGALTLVLHQDAAVARTFAWPAAVKWAGGTAPTVTATLGAIDVFTLLTLDGGTTWYGFTGGQDFS